MPYSALFPALPDSARLWVHVAGHDVTPQAQKAVVDVLQSFFETWDSHGRPVTGQAAWRDDQFLFVAAHIDAPGQSISGCATDALVQTVDQAAHMQEISWASALTVVYRPPEGGVSVVPRTEFADLASQEAVDATTPVFDPSITELRALRSGAFEQPAGSTWHARAFSLAYPA